MDTLELTWRITHGSDGVDSDPTNPLSRAVNRLFETGKPDPRLAMCFFQDPLPPPEWDILVRWLGVFVLSAGKKVIFFPGYANLPVHFRSFHGQTPVLDESFLADHFTLESNFRRWHLTSPKSTAHLSAFPTAPLGDGRFLWFGMSVAD